MIPDTIDVLDAINKAVKEYGWEVHSWEDRYGRGTWAMVGYSNDVQIAKDITWGGDVESLEFGTYLYEEGAWLPIESGSTVFDALISLNKKISPQIDNKKWRVCVSNTIERIEEVNDGNYGLRIAIENDSEGIFSIPSLRNNGLSLEEDEEKIKILVLDETSLIFKKDFEDNPFKRLRKEERDGIK